MLSLLAQLQAVAGEESISYDPLTLPGQACLAYEHAQAAKSKRRALMQQILWIMRNGDVWSTTLLMYNLGLDRRTIGRALERLLSRGWIKCHGTDNDRLATFKMYRITASGLEAVYGHANRDKDTAREEDSGD